MSSFITNFQNLFKLIDIHIMRVVQNCIKNAWDKSVHDKCCTNCCKLLHCNTCNTTTNTLSRMCPPKPGFLSLLPGHSFIVNLHKMCLFIKTQAYKYVNDKINTVKSMSYKPCHIISIM